MTDVDLESFVAELAAVAALAILPLFRTPMVMADKGGQGGFDPVTEADRAAEAAMRDLIRSTFPTHGIVGEEYGDHQPDAEYVWVLDPIDGTKSFIAGFPTWGTLVALERRGAPLLGMMHQPFTRESFFGDNARATWTGPDPRGAPVVRPLRTRSCPDLAAATLMTTSPSLLTSEERGRFDRVAALARLTRYGGDCYAYCMLAAGHVDLVIESGLKPYDIAALIPIVGGAGGVVTTWSGEDAAQGGAIVAAADPRLHATTLALLRN